MPLKRFISFDLTQFQQGTLTYLTMQMMTASKVKRPFMLKVWLDANGVGGLLVRLSACQGDIGLPNAITQTALGGFYAV
ncbi:MAG TPA: hypothetical protein DCM28_06430 [Phycisphaerales bacterium]|nr:hypothetical protein [Phycisphaerales bacterium]HCD35004.1 hypothetical protein [Phycisphaerales bacterium]|tara:strand:- start:445 stop:681 length:237 start_codon:yes stop_codon:yes gene_type:complete